MSISRYLSLSPERIFAKELAIQLSKELPPAFMEKSSKVLSVNKITRLLERTNQAAVDYQKEFDIGFIKRAVLANAFKWELKNMNYPDEFVDMATECLVVDLSKAKSVTRKKA